MNSNHTDSIHHSNVTATTHSSWMSQHHQDRTGNRSMLSYLSTFLTIQLLTIVQSCGGFWYVSPVYSQSNGLPAQPLPINRMDFSNPSAVGPQNAQKSNLTPPLLKDTRNQQTPGNQFLGAANARKQENNRSLQAGSPASRLPATNSILNQRKDSILASREAIVSKPDTVRLRKANEEANKQNSLPSTLLSNNPQVNNSNRNGQVDSRLGASNSLLKNPNGNGGSNLEPASHNASANHPFPTGNGLQPAANFGNQPLRTGVGMANRDSGSGNSALKNQTLGNQGQGSQLPNSSQQSNNLGGQLEPIIA